MTVYRKATFALMALKYFDQEFIFDNSNWFRLMKMIHPKDRKNFDFQVDGAKDDYLSIARDQIFGVCRYALHERCDEVDVERAVRNNTR